MVKLLGVFIASFLFIFFRAFQQRNVAFDRYIAVFPTSLLMAVTEMVIIVSVASTGFDLMLALAIGSGGASGCMLAMYLHKRIFHD